MTTGASKMSEDHPSRTGKQVASSMRPGESPLLAINISSKPLMHKRGVEFHHKRLAVSSGSDMEDLGTSNAYENILPQMSSNRS